MERQLLTVEQIRKDLGWVSYNRNSGYWFVLWFVLGIAWFVLIALELYFLSWLSGAASVYFMVKIFSKPFPKSIRSPDDLLFDTDVCVKKEEGFDSWEYGQSRYLTFQKEGRILLGGVWKTGYPSFVDTEVGDSFYVVAHKKNPKSKKFYSMKEWYLVNS